MPNSFKSNVAALSAGLLAFAVASAAQAEMATIEVGEFYVGLGAGGVMPGDTTISSGTQDGVTFNGNAEIEYDLGFAVTGAAGYHINDYLAVEAEVGYAQFDHDSFSGSGTITSGGTTVSGSASSTLDGTVKTFSGLANLIVSPFGDMALRPYLGAGVGMVAYNEEIDKVGTLSLSYDESDEAFMAAGLVGLDYRFSDQLSMGGQYRYVWADTGSGLVDDMTAHSLFLKLDYAF
ncbi:MAG: outer membrane beta-barrel protein [Magnetovibrionaceae bacterium]